MADLHPHQGPTLTMFVEEVWAPRARRRLVAKTWERDALVYRRHIQPYLGALPLAAIDAEVLTDWQDGLEARGVGGPTLIKAIGILSGVSGRQRDAPDRPASAATPWCCSSARARGDGDAPSESANPSPALPCPGPATSAAIPTRR